MQSVSNTHSQFLPPQTSAYYCKLKGVVWTHDIKLSTVVALMAVSERFWTSQRLGIFTITTWGRPEPELIRIRASIHRSGWGRASIDWFVPWNSASDSATWCYILSCTPMFWWPKLQIENFPENFSEYPLKWIPDHQNRITGTLRSIHQQFVCFRPWFRIFPCYIFSCTGMFQRPKLQTINFSENSIKNPLEWAADHQNRTTGTLQ